EAVGIRIARLFEATWSYQEFVDVRPFGPELEGQAYAYSTRGGRVSGERLSGDYSLVQYPRRRSDDVLLPDAHGMVRASRDQIVMTRFGGFGVPAGPGRRAITHWMRFVAAGEFAWLNGVIVWTYSTSTPRSLRARAASSSGLVDWRREQCVTKRVNTAVWRCTTRPF